MTPDQMLRTYRVVSNALGKRPGESIESAARRVKNTGVINSTAYLVAKTILRRGEIPPWDRMNRAALVAEFGE